MRYRKKNRRDKGKEARRTGALVSDVRREKYQDKGWVSGNLTL